MKMSKSWGGGGGKYLFVLFYIYLSGHDLRECLFPYVNLFPDI